jgi:hypothetical protein
MDAHRNIDCNTIGGFLFANAGQHHSTPARLRVRQSSDGSLLALHATRLFRINMLYCIAWGTFNILHKEGKKVLREQRPSKGPKLWRGIVESDMYGHRQYRADSDPMCLLRAKSGVSAF